MEEVGIVSVVWVFFFFQAEDGIRDAQESRGLGDVYKRQTPDWSITLQKQVISLAFHINSVNQAAAARMPAPFIPAGLAFPVYLFRFRVVMPTPL